MLDAEHLRLPGEASAKLANQWEGPFTIVEMVHPLAARLRLPTTLKIHPVIHVSRLRHFRDGEEKYPGRAVVLNPPPVTAIGGEDAYGVDCFLAERYRGRAKVHEIYVRWVGYSAAHDQWRPATDLLSDLGKQQYEELLAEMRSKPQQFKKRKPRPKR